MSALPAEFAALEPFVQRWALATENARSAQRWAATPADFQAFYDAGLPLLPQLVAVFEGIEPGRVPAELLTLYHLSLALAEVAPHVELYSGASEVPNSFAGSRFVAAHGERADG